MTLLEEEHVLAGQHREVDGPVVSASRWSDGTASRKSSENRSSECRWRSWTGSARMATSRRPLRSRSQDLLGLLLDEQRARGRGTGGGSRVRRGGAGTARGWGRARVRIVAGLGILGVAGDADDVSVSPRITRARSTTCAPASVRRMWRGLRSMSGTPSSFSSLMICVDSVGWLTKHASAARPK